MFEYLSLNRAAISAVIIIVLALALVGSIAFGLRDSVRRRSDEVFGDPLRTSNGWYWAVAGVCSLLLVWYYFSWGAARPVSRSRPTKSVRSPGSMRRCRRSMHHCPPGPGSTSQPRCSAATRRSSTASPPGWGSRALTPQKRLNYAISSLISGC